MKICWVQSLFLTAGVSRCVVHGWRISTPTTSAAAPTAAAAAAPAAARPPIALYSHAMALDRRRLIKIGSAAALATSTVLLAPLVLSSSALGTDKVFVRRTDQVRYQFQPPAGAIPGNKPLQTHLDEINFTTDRRGYTFGITVDPVRIASLSEFGTPSELATKVVLAELARDGITDVTLMEDPVESHNNDDDDDDDDTATIIITLNYQSVGQRRGTTRNVARFFVREYKLYALTAQCFESDYAMLQTEIMAAVQSFRPGT